MKWLLRLALLMVMASGAVAGWGYLSYQSFLQQHLPNCEPVAMTVQPGQGYAKVLNQLVEKGLAKQRWHWWLLGRRSDLAGRIQAGEYLLPVAMTAPELLDYLARGKVVQHALTIVDGWNFKDLRAALERHQALQQTITELPDAEVALRVDPQLTHPEGWFLPETYHFPRGTTDLELLQRAYGAQKTLLASVWQEREDKDLLKSPLEMLTLASIVEKETGLGSERAKIAGVFMRRLKLGMRLQTDPTVIYGLGEAFDGNLRRRDLRTDTPYNTYTRHGLPPTPIAIPGKAALASVAHPEDGQALYFVARGDGSHQFSVTLDEHNAAVRKYQIGNKK